jgi:hypothetical protein
MKKRAIGARFPRGLFARVSAEAAFAVGVAWGLFGHAPGRSVLPPAKEQRREIVARWKQETSALA